MNDFVVIWDEKDCGFRARFVNGDITVGSFPISMLKQTKVIGNIHESNPNSL
jgi:hypothetical protein